MKTTLGNVSIAVENGLTITEFGDGLSLVADHSEQPGQAGTAAFLAMSVEEMNATHDLGHSMIAWLLGLPFSPTLHDVAAGRPVTDLHGLEEDAVKALQRFAKAAGADMIEAAKMHGRVL